MAHRIEIGLKKDLPDPSGRETVSRIKSDLGINIDEIRTADAYLIDKELTLSELDLITREVFLDPVIQDAAINAGLRVPFDWLVEVGFKPGVTDNLARTAKEATERSLGKKFEQYEGVYSKRLYFVSAEIDFETVQKIASDLLANDLIQTCRIVRSGENRLDVSVPKVTSKSETRINTVNLNVSDAELVSISKEGVLALSLEEMKVIKAYYNDRSFLEIRKKHGLSSLITDCELEVLAQTWSEHCKHKIFNARIDYVEDGNSHTIDSLFDTYIRKSTELIRQRRGKQDYCLSVFKDNAGVIKFDDSWNLAVKVETHNSPSALDPYGGALTGIVGVNRDPFGTGLGSRLIFNTDVFCFAPPDFADEIPPRLLHPRRVFEGVRQGVEHGGNKSGIPTVNGAVVFDDRFLGKPLVYCGTGGIMPAMINGKLSHEKKANPGDRIVMTGGRIGKDGIHGATFSSEELHEGSPVTAVQIGDPITQKRMTDFLLIARDKGLYSSITDNGAGGLSSSVGEMARESGGAKLLLDRAPVKYPGLQPWEILLSEAQERMTVAVPPEHINEFLELAQFMDVEATDLGEFTNDGNFLVTWKDQAAVMLPLSFLHDGLPQMELRAVWNPPKHKEPSQADRKSGNLTDILVSLLGRWNICSKERLIRQYDHEVQGQSVVKPLIGATEDGPGDAAVLNPILSSYRGLAVGCGIAPRFSDIDTYDMMAAVIDEAVRNIVSAGADPDYMAGLDNFCWCDPIQSEKTPDGEYKLAQLVRANKALYDVCVAYGIPCISGKDSMKNDYQIGDRKISIPPTVLFTAVGIVPDVRMSVTPDFKNADDVVYLLGLTRDELGGSEYFAHLGFVGNKAPKLWDMQESIHMYRALHQAIQLGLVASAHDLSDGGLGVALAESAFSGKLGALIELSHLTTASPLENDSALFSESLGRILVTVDPENEDAFLGIMGDFPLSKLGVTTLMPELIVKSPSGEIVIDADVEYLKQSWQKPLGV